MLELWRLPLRGAPYAFTPFCKGKRMNEKTKGFRFWDEGFWKGHLSPFPGHDYHISALFVVDVDKMVQYGDKLRQGYKNLAGDANSLANLDQDLPNFLQVRNQVPLASLPREWLWCESWCSEESKAPAKTFEFLRGGGKGSKIEGKMGVKRDSRDGLGGHQPTARRCDFDLW